MTELYEIVQYSPNILSRLYLMTAAGAAVVKAKEVNARPIMNDVIEMAKAIQHPVRGILLRYYMMKKLKEIMSDKVCKYGG